jgi:hypothetical protein
MKSYSKRIRVLRRLAIAGCMAALVVPTSASAMLPNDSGWHPQAQKQQPYTLPSNFRTEVQTPSKPTPAAFVPSASVRPEVQTPAPQSSAPTTAVIREIQTVTDNSGRTLAIVLAAVALAVALCSLAYASIRLTRIQRREVGSH